ncbi:helix-turn-helix transcriptional regulator [Mammaliicoccus sp. E-M21]|uniref:helix-turn-helix domain-containing protein n=1 Tax=Mammaliicoccus sp. E-M21 TaxID=2898681 RepID=UPI001EFB3FD3|nr:helix-turn-helix transcriptional regulator [Mammaliicoccus sp. E-M21]
MKDDNLITQEELNNISLYILKELKHQRQFHNKTLKEVSELTGISEPSLSRIENGRVLQTSIQYIVKIAKCYDIGIDTLIKNAMIKYNLDYPDNNKD